MSEFDVERFVLISTDKAVNPKTVMGQSKPHCRASWCIGGTRRGDAVRIRLGAFWECARKSRSVVPDVPRQIADGGPVTITHPDMTRYFMTIPEAVQLVLQAGAFGNEGEVFVLDMGEPVRVLRSRPRT